MKAMEAITNSDSWKSDLLCLPDSVISHALVACAELAYPLAKCKKIRSLMPSIRGWARSPSQETSKSVAAELFRYIHATGLYELGGVSFLDLPTDRWPNVLEDTSESLAEDCVLWVANSIATIDEDSFFGSAGFCLVCLERCLFLNQRTDSDTLRRLIDERLRQQTASSKREVANHPSKRRAGCIAWIDN